MKKRVNSSEFIKRLKTAKSIDVIYTSDDRVTFRNYITIKDFKYIEDQIIIWDNNGNLIYIPHTQITYDDCHDIYYFCNFSLEAYVNRRSPYLEDTLDAVIGVPINAPRHKEICG